MVMTQLYRHFDSEGQLLYVGISINALERSLERYKQHSGTEWFPSVAKITVTDFQSRDEALEAEAKAIKAEKPKFNIRHLRSRATNGRKSRTTPSLIAILQKAITKNGSQAAVAKMLGVSPQRLNNWIRAGVVPQAWEWGLEQRLNGNGAAKGRSRANR